ncbi:hypothetical protein [Streptomyces sp. NPDC023838]|uniref:hypothetical protein n=1 Tax=Streptomyces sp. NPDC023838 TaxID=3154325 RepID=UPI0033E95307
MVRDQLEIERKNQHCLEAFVVRARRVAEHSLVEDRESLEAFADPRVVFWWDENGKMRLRNQLPAEEAVESAAARIRPILLETEDCFHMKALKALGYACRTSPKDAEWVQAARAEWKTRVAPATPAGAAYRVMISNTATGEQHELDSHRLALAWIYGDVVHHDMERRKEGDPFGLRDRFRAAVPLVAWTMAATIELLGYIEALQKDGLLHLRPAVFDAQVALKTTEWEEGEVQAFYAPEGAEMPSDASPEGWIPLTKDTDLSVLRHRSGAQLLHPTSAVGATAPSNEVDVSHLDGVGSTVPVAHDVPRQPARDWQAELIERWKAMQT